MTPPPPSHQTDIISSNIYSFSQKSLFSPRTHTNFPGASIFSSNRYYFSRKPYLVVEQILFSRRPLWPPPPSHQTDIISSNIYSFSQKSLFSPRTHTNFPGASIFSLNRYYFSRKPYLVLEQILFSRRPLWPPPPFPSNRYFVNRSRWLFSKY